MLICVRSMGGGRLKESRDAPLARAIAITIIMVSRTNKDFTASGPAEKDATIWSVKRRRVARPGNLEGFYCHTDERVEPDRRDDFQNQIDRKFQPRSQIYPIRDLARIQQLFGHLVNEFLPRMRERWNAPCADRLDDFRL